MGKAHSVSLMRMLLPVVFIISGCGKVPSDYFKDLVEPIVHSRVVGGRLSFPPGSPINYSRLDVLSLVDQASVDAQGNFAVSIPDGKFSLILVVDRVDNHIVAFGTVKEEENYIMINDSSTALGLILFFPLEWYNVGLDMSEVITAIEQSEHWGTLVNRVSSIMTRDPENLMSYEVYPMLFQEALSIVNEIARSSVNLETLMSSNTIRLSIGSGERVEVENLSEVPYGISAYDLQNFPFIDSSYRFNQIPIFVNGVSDNISQDINHVSYQLDNGNFFMMFGRTNLSDIFSEIRQIPFGSKPLNQLREQILQNAIHDSDYVRALKEDALFKGFVGGCLNIISHLLEVLYVPNSGSYEIVHAIYSEGPQIGLDQYSKVNINKNDFLGDLYSPQNVLKDMLLHINSNMDGYIDVLEHISNTVGKEFNINKKTFRRLTVGLLNSIYALNMLADTSELLKYMYDMVYTESYIGSEVCIQSDTIYSHSPPSKPVIELTPIYPRFGDTIRISLSSRTSHNDQIYYHLLINNDEFVVDTGPLPPSQSLMLSYVPPIPGRKEIIAYAYNQDGVVSEPSSIVFYVLPGLNGSFYENFENYPVGPFVSDTIWNVNQYATGSVWIANTGDSSNFRSVRLTNYDPLYGTSPQSIAMIYSEFSDAPDTVEFSIMIHDSDDEFAIRASQYTDDLNTTSFFLVVLNGYLNYVNTDTNDYSQLIRLNPGTWYRIRLTLNWRTNTYSVSIDDSLFQQNIGFVGYNRTGNPISDTPLFIAHSLLGGPCRGAFLDNISVKNARLRKPSFLIKNPQEVSIFNRRVLK